MRSEHIAAGHGLTGHEQGKGDRLGVVDDSHFNFRRLLTSETETPEPLAVPSYAHDLA